MMNYNLVSSLHGPIALSTTVPAGVAGMVVPGSRVSFAEGPFGRVLYQELHSGQFSFGLNTYRAYADVQLQQSSYTDALQAFLVLKNNLRFSIGGIGNSVLKEGQYNLFYCPETVCTLRLEKGHEYRLFTTWYSAGILEQLYNFFPELQQFIHASAGAPSLLLNPPGRSTMQIIDIITSLPQCPFDENMRRFYFDTKLNELLFTLLVQKYGVLTGAGRLTRADRAAIHEARNIIERSASRHLSNREIAQQVGMNEFKLKHFFKQSFGIGMFEFMLRVRMQQARVLLLETAKPIKEIATISGYTSIQNFQTAFRKYYNCTPASLRKQ